jgi:hypothetical protein
MRREESDSERGPVSEEEQQTWFRNMWEGKEEQQAQVAQPSEPEPEMAAATEENEFNDDDEFGDDFDDFAEGQEADDDFGDFDEADETPMAAEPPSPVQTQQPGLLDGLVSSVQINFHCQKSSESC